MGESSACLLRSYSQPSPQTKQGDPYRCLTSSVSFGRYMSESLDWEKWSAFTQNRYMEDVKKYSRPGTVAQMKAHFEAHYKKKADERSATTLIQQHNQDSMQMDNQLSRGTPCEKEAAQNMVRDSVEVSRCTPPSGGELRAPEGAKLVDAAENQLVGEVVFSNCLQIVEDSQAIDCNQNIDGREQDNTQFGKVENVLKTDQVGVCGKLKSIEDDKKRACGEDGKTQSKTIGELRGPASLDKRKPVFSPFKSRSHIGVPKPPAPPKHSVPIQKRQHKNANSGSREETADVKKRKEPTRSLHMSISLAQKETKPLSPILQRIVNSKLVKTLTGKAAQATQGKALQDTVDISEYPAVGLKQKKISSSKSNSTCTRNIQSHTVSRPFSFKSDERAAKRKEFFRRLEQSAKVKETEKHELHGNSKVKAKNDLIYMPHMATSKVGPCSDYLRTRTPSDSSKLIPANLCSPFVSGEIVKDSNARQPWMLTASCKEGRGKNDQSLARPLKSVSIKSPSENASPNILL